MNLSSLERQLFADRGINTILTQNDFVYGHRGCNFCGGSGYKGRVAIMEMVDINDEIRTEILRNADESTIGKLAAKYGCKPMYHLGLEAVSRGATDFSAIGELVASIGFSQS
jgi:type IV pilus assembly protein PilB